MQNFEEKQGNSGYLHGFLEKNALFLGALVLCLGGIFLAFSFSGNGKNLSGNLSGNISSEEVARFVSTMEMERRITGTASGETVRVATSEVQKGGIVAEVTGVSTTATTTTAAATTAPAVVEAMPATAEKAAPTEKVVVSKTAVAVSASDGSTQKRGADGELISLKEAPNVPPPAPSVPSFD